MVDVLNALTGPSSMLRTSGTPSTKRKKYKEGTESFNEKELGCFTSKYFECNDNMVARFSSEKQKEYLKKILIHFDRKKNEGKLVEAYYYKEKDEVLKEFIQEDEGVGCIQQ